MKGNFLIKPNKKQEYSRVYDNAFLWNEDNLYIMACHRLSLWCWLQVEGIFENKHSFIHIDRHTDARRWEAPGEAESLKKILNNFSSLKDFNIFENFQCPFKKTFETDRDMRPCITYDNFVHLAAEARLFKHYYIYASQGDWHTTLNEKDFSFYKKTSKIYNLEDTLKKCEGKCVIDVDLDFFDDIRDHIKRVSSTGLLIQVFKIIEKYRDDISMLTISINDVSGNQMWKDRMEQLSIIKDILNLEVPIPVME